jgi:hypothetical protein
VVPVTVVAGGSDDQTRFKEPPSMNALCVVLDDVVFRNFIDPGNMFSFAVTTATEKGNICFIGAGVGIGIVKNIMVPVTFIAAGRMGIVHQQGLSVDPAPVFIGRSCVAVSAIHRFEPLSMGQSFIVCIFMTGNAGVAYMHRSLQKRGVYVHRNGPSVAFSGKGRVLVAHEAILIGLGMNESGKGGCQ